VLELLLIFLLNGSVAVSMDDILRVKCGVDDVKGQWLTIQSFESQ
jgi:hypothetical protein